MSRTPHPAGPEDGAADRAEAGNTGSAGDAGADPERPDEAPAAGTGADAPFACDVCGSPMYERHCRIICPVCGYQRDCSDP